MKDYIEQLRSKYKKLWTRQEAISLVWTIVIGIVAMVAQKTADTYVGSLHSVYVGDLILDHVRAFDIDGFIVQASLWLTFICVTVAVLNPKYILFTVKSLSLFIIVRSFFISLTHLGINPHQIVFDTQDFGFTLYNYLYNTNGDFFFSGHTGLPALMAFIFWQEKKIRYFFIIASIVLGTSVLLGHIHYSIDVFAAPFMVYGIYTLSTHLFHNDLKLISQE